MSTSAPDDEIPGVPALLLQDTALFDPSNKVQLHYPGADASVAGLLVVPSRSHVARFLRHGNMRWPPRALMYNRCKHFVCFS